MSGPGDGKRARRVADTRARLIDVSLDLYVEQGFGPTTIDQITAAAGIGRSSFFRYFTGKDAVLFAPSLAPTEWFLDELAARPAGESLLVSVASVYTEGAWPQIDRHDLVRSRKVLKAEPTLASALIVQLTTGYTPALTAALRNRAPDVDLMTIGVIADISMNWASWAVMQHLRDGRPLADHFADVIRTTATLAGELAALPGQVLA
jgi:AcrR family transcriptional regulator